MVAKMHDTMLSAVRVIGVIFMGAFVFRLPPIVLETTVFVRPRTRQLFVRADMQWADYDTYVLAFLHSKFLSCPCGNHLLVKTNYALCSLPIV